MKATYIKGIICLLVLNVTIINTLRAQEKPYREPDGTNYWYVELGGAAFLYSINYEKLLVRTSSLGWVGRVGLSYGFTDRTFLNKIKNVPNQVLAPFTTSILLGGKERKEKLELGGGFTLIATSPTSREVVPTGVLGFRVVETNSVCLRISYTPFIRNREFVNWFGVSLGQQF
jgi:hypothetical protein